MTIEEIEQHRAEWEAIKREARLGPLNKPQKIKDYLRLFAISQYLIEREKAERRAPLQLTESPSYGDFRRYRFEVLRSISRVDSSVYLAASGDLPGAQAGLPQAQGC